MSDYKKMMGYKKEKKKQKEIKVNEILNSLKEEFDEVKNDDEDIEEFMKKYIKGPSAYENISEGPAYEYKKDIKNIDKSYKLHAKSVLNFYDKLRKKGLDKEASDLLDTYKKNYVTFKKQYDKIISKLL